MEYIEKILRLAELLKIEQGTALFMITSLDYISEIMIRYPRTQLLVGAAALYRMGLSDKEVKKFLQLRGIDIDLVDIQEQETEDATDDTTDDVGYI